MLNSFKLWGRFGTWATRRGIEWRDNNGVVELIYYLLPNQRGLINVLSEGTTFKELMTKHITMNFQFKFPKDFDTNTPVTHFLLNEETPMTIEVKYKEEISYLHNRAKQAETAAIIRGINNKKGVYRLSNYNEIDMGQARSLLTSFYLKLQAEGYCRLNNLTVKNELTPALRQEILNYLCFRNQTDDQANISAFENNREDQWNEIANCEQQIAEMEKKADRVLRLYQLGAIGVTATHILSFGYMIFFVDWLGWDIIEPLTFSVGSIYFLLALRFFRKFRRDRGPETIRDRLRELVMSPKDMMRLQSLREKVAQQRDYLKTTEMKMQIARNRLGLGSTLATQLRQ